MKRTISLICGCDFHKVEIEEFTIDKMEGSFLSICIYAHKSEYTGKLLKKPKLLADVVLHPDQTALFKSVFKND
jgi:hypothetical protein